MVDSTPLFDDCTFQLSAVVSSRDDNAAVIVVSSRHEHDGMKTWTPRGTAQRDSLAEELTHHFGADHVSVKRITKRETTDREIVITPRTPSDATHAQEVAGIVRGFIERNQIELDTGDEQHVHELVRDASKLRLRDGIKTIIDDQLLNGSEERTDAIMKLLRLRKEERGGGHSGRR